MGNITDIEIIEKTDVCLRYLRDSTERSDENRLFLFEMEGKVIKRCGRFGNSEDKRKNLKNEFRI